MDGQIRGSRRRKIETNIAAESAELAKFHFVRPERNALLAGFSYRIGIAGSFVPEKKAVAGRRNDAGFFALNETHGAGVSTAERAEDVARPGLRAELERVIYAVIADVGNFLFLRIAELITV